MEIVRRTKVITETKDLTVSTIKLGFRRYDTVVFDDHADKRHEGKVVGGFVINKSNRYDTTRKAAMDAHREALYAARTEPIA